MTVNEVIHSFFEHMRTFKDRDNFIWLTMMDVHHIINLIPDISSQKDLSFSAHCTTPWHDDSNTTKSVFVNTSKDNEEIYASEIKRIDYYLKFIYDYIENNYKDDEFLVSLVSDHGAAFQDEEANKNPLSIERTKVPWMIRGGNIPHQKCYQLTENTDFFSSILNCSGIENNNNDLDSFCPSILGGKVDRDFVVSQSIYPNQTYKAILRDKYFEYEFESEKPVSLDGKIQGKLNYIQRRMLNQLKKSDNELIVIEKYKTIIELKIIEWNNKQSSGIGENK